MIWLLRNLAVIILLSIAYPLLAVEVFVWFVRDFLDWIMNPLMDLIDKLRTDNE